MTQATTKTDVPQIQATRFYDQFKIMGGNRSVDSLHVEKLKASMIENPDWFATKPIVVNDAGYIIDGQHRLAAAKQLNLPVYFVVGEGMNLCAARAMNIRQKQWTLRDYAQSYADGGNDNYRFILDMARKNPNLPLGAIIQIGAGVTNRGYDLNVDFRAGRYEIPDKMDAINNIETLSAVSKMAHRRLNIPFVRIYLSVREREDFDEARFLKNVERVGDKLIISGLAKDNYRAIEDVYNHSYSESNHIRLY